MVTDLQPGEAVPGLDRDSVIVVIALFGAHDLFARCLTSVLAHTPPEVPILIADDAGPDPASRALAERMDAGGHARSPLLWLRQPANLGFVGNCNAALDATAPADVALLNSDVEVAAGWLDGLHEAARCDSLVASATALTNHGSILSVPVRNVEVAQFPSPTDFAAAAAGLRARSPRLRPRIPTAIGHCMLLRRHALELCGAFDTAFAPAYGEEVDWSQRAALQGFVHVAADDVLVLHHGRGSLNVEGARDPVQEAHEAIVESRYPSYRAAVADAEADLFGPLARSLSLARRELTGPSVTVDARTLGPTVSGTQIHTLELICALAELDGLALRVLLPDEVGDYAAAVLRGLADVETISIAGVREQPPPRSDVVHRPFQITSAEDLVLLRHLGERLVITQQDVISFRNPGYHGGADDWLTFRRVTRDALAAADAVVFESEHAREDAAADDLVARNDPRVVVSPIGVDHRLAQPDATRPPVRPAGLPAQPGPYLLQLGTDYRHKNRLFALRLFEALVDEHGWDGGVVFAGPKVRHGSSAGDEAAFLATRPGLARRVHVLPAVTDAGKRWLYEHAAAALYPTLYEGFGLVPFEAAGFGLPTLFAHVTALEETLAGIEAPLVPWDVRASAERVHRLLGDPAAVAAQVTAIRAAGAKLTWDRHARGLLELYRDLPLAPGREAMRLAAEALALEAERGRIEGLYWHLRDELGPLALALVGPDGRLPEASQRALAALAGRPATARPLHAALGLVHRAGRRNGPQAGR